MVKKDLKDLKDGKDSKDDGRGGGDLGEIRRWWGAWGVGASHGPVVNPALLIRSFGTAFPAEAEAQWASHCGTGGLPALGRRSFGCQ